MGERQSRGYGPEQADGRCVAEQWLQGLPPGPFCIWSIWGAELQPDKGVLREVGPKLGLSLWRAALLSRWEELCFLVKSQLLDL